MTEILRETKHRPWPLPGKRWILSQRWRDLLFLHYRVEASEIQRRLPPGVKVQEFDGSAWVAVVPFRMENVTPRGLPAVRGLSTFPELNVRTYVETGGKPGVWFFSLDAMSRITVSGGRFLYALPYYYARMAQTERADQIHFESQRAGGAARFRGWYRGTGAPFYAQPGTFEQWAAERYCLYSQPADGRVLRLEVHHPPWLLQAGEAKIETSTVLAAAGIEPISSEVRVHFTRGVDVVSYPPEVVPSN